MPNYFCPDCGWEGLEKICAICQTPTENLDVDPETGKVKDEQLNIVKDELDNNFNQEDGLKDDQY